MLYCFRDRTRDTVYIFCIYSGQTIDSSKGARVVKNYVSQIWNEKIYISIPTTS